MRYNILFEDRYGCYRLYNEINKNRCDTDIKSGLSNSGVFELDEYGDLNVYDLTIVVFDLDSYGNKELMLPLDKFENKMKSYFEYLNKIILIPVFFCFETLFFYDYRFKNLILSPKKYRKGNTERLLKIYTTYYNYSKINPENLDYYKENMKYLENRFFPPQDFYKLYVKEIIRSLYSNATQKDIKDNILKNFNKLKNNLDKLLIEEYNISIDEIIIPSEVKYTNTYALNRFMEQNLNYRFLNNRRLSYQDILQGMLESKDLYYNQRFLDLLTCDDLEYMRKYSGIEGYNQVLDLLKDYERRLKAEKENNYDIKSMNFFF